ncbi:poly(ADP-ribose) glycohydrolase 1-like isoform X1 [Mangifera indica]|uniref:poly(ADP-ribose) glycohydrolase 1-like isoform X1 n=1 Tax=Mangifera indica TaxID=29780 RepID=UPI001CF97148|nr:poly(ADP-ribose) glycohydrolase 1-like isoform X1 [Mangifera indica]
MAKGPEHIRINSGELLSVAICDIRSLVSLFEPLAPFAFNDCVLSFDDLHGASSTAIETNEGTSINLMLRNSDPKSSQFRNHKDFPCIVTGNWGCGAFGGDPELKAVIQWLAASPVNYSL